MSWDRAELDRLFKEVLSLEGEERTQRLAAIEQEDADLAAQIQGMINKFEQMEKIFETSVLPKGMLAAFSDDDDDEDDEERETRIFSGSGKNPRSEPEKMPETIGPYKVLNKIGEGGMGLVYQVRQEEPRRDLALKLLAHHRTTEEFRARFEAEYRVLALMKHHNIAAMHEVGQTEDGHVYFTMEYVPGIPITRYCQERKLGLRERLVLFQQVCEGVMHAHQKAVVHRDLKPNNILVTEENERPVVKIIDFGIAKGLEDSPVERRFETRLGTLVGTLEYMSHEQLLGTEEVDTRGDIYSLGVVLYEMLVGALPLDDTQLKTSSAEAQLRFYREEEPIAPSVRLKALDADDQVTPSELRGDVDWIILKAMEKNLQRRYGTVGEFKQDINYFLDDQPVTARPPGYGYVVSKFVRRNRVFVGSGALVLFALLVGLWVSVSANFRVNRARLETEKALRHLQESNAFLKDMLESADPNKQGADAKIVDVLNRAEERLAGVDVPEVEAELRDILGSTYRGLGMYDRGIDQLDRSYTLYRMIRGDHDPTTLEVQEHLAQALRQGRRKEKAKAHYREIIRLYTELYGPEHRKTLHAKASHAFCFLNTSQAGTMLDPLTKVLDAQKRVLGEEDKDTLRTMNGLGLIYTSTGEYLKAASLAKQAYLVQTEILGAAHPQTLSSLANTAHSLARGNNYVEAEDILRKLLSTQRNHLGRDHFLVLNTKGRLAECLLKQGKTTEAQQILHRLVDQSIEIFGTAAYETVFYAYLLGLAYEALDDTPEEGKSIWFELAGLFEHLTYRNVYAQAMQLKKSKYLVSAGNLDDGLYLGESIVAWLRENNGNTSNATLDAEVVLAFIYKDGSKATKGESLLCDIMAHADHAGTYQRWRIRAEYAQYLTQLERYDEAHDLLQECLDYAPKGVSDSLSITKRLKSIDMERKASANSELRYSK